jgi:micrococcal nuclease
MPPASADGWRVERVIDGDTLIVAGPDGPIRVRLIGINAPERGECLDGEATAQLTDLLGGQSIVLVADVSNVDRYGRLLRYVETSGGLDVGLELVRQGLAISRRYAPDLARNDLYDAAQTEAQAAERGIWARDACGIADEADGFITIEIRYDADGNDNDNLNDEWVRFQNTGPQQVDLDGWLVADESSSNRYRFRNLVLEPSTSVTLFSGCGTDTQDERYWCSEGSAIWNNSGDTVFLYNSTGALVASHSY